MVFALARLPSQAQERLVIRGGLRAVRESVSARSRWRASLMAGLLGPVAIALYARISNVPVWATCGGSSGGVEGRRTSGRLCGKADGSMRGLAVRWVVLGAHGPVRSGRSRLIVPIE